MFSSNGKTQIYLYINILSEWLLFILENLTEMGFRDIIRASNKIIRLLLAGFY